VDDDALASTAAELAGRAASVPRELARRTKATLAAVPDVTTHDAAVDLELEAQLWSLSQPDFADRLKALQKKISSR
jgi:enoyl-CoA hydratase